MKTVTRVSVFILIAFLAVPLFLASSASVSKSPSPKSTNNQAPSLNASPARASRALTIAPGLERLLAGPEASMQPLLPLLQASPTETITIYQSDCMTAATEFNLGDTICAKLSGAPLGSRPTQVLRRLSIANPNGYIVSEASVTTDPQTLLFTLPATATSTVGGETVDNRGEWNVSSVGTAAGGIRASASFTVSDANQAVSDLVITKVIVGDEEVGADSNISFAVFVVNYGPNDAADVEITDAVPTNTTFVSAAQNVGPTFTCTNPSAGGNGTSTCTIESLPSRSKVKFTFTYHVDAGAQPKTIIANTATISSDTTERVTADNSSTAIAIVTAGAGAGDDCTLTCPANVVVTANTTQGGQPGAFVKYSAAGVNGNCGAVTNNPGSGSFFTAGTHTVTSTSSTGATCTFTVTVLSTSAPTISCPTDKVATAPVGSDEATVNVGTPTFTASGGGTVVGVRSDSTPPVLDQDGNVITPGVPKPLTDPYPVGVTGIVWTVTDADGRTASCRQKITVIGNACGTDTENPTITAPPDVTVGTGPGNTGCSVALDDELGLADATDNCSVDVTVSGIPAGSAFAPGTYTLTYTATDGAGNTATDTQVVTVIDDTPPSIVAPADASYVCLSEVPAGNASQAARGDVFDEDGNLLPPGPPFDNCGTPTVEVTDTTNGGAGSASSPLIITRTYTATDAAGNTSSDSQTITVIDSTPPTVTAPDDASYQCASEVPAANASQATASDNCSVNVAVSESNNGGAGSIASPLVITRTYTATDGAGNSASDSQTITVIDNTPPVITTPANITVYLPLNSTATSMAVNYPNPATAIDNCAGSVSISYSPASGSTFSVGTTTVTVTATDDHGNSATATFTVTVLYNFTGFFSPVGNLPTMNVVNAGRAIPVKFSLSGNKGLDIFVAGSPYTVGINCDGTGEVDVVETLTAGSSSLSYNSTSDQYNYVWKTENSWAGTCRQLVVKLNDGSEHRANFKFK
jgi:uncharacterized repeat protein (TIGR01451 family)